MSGRLDDLDDPDYPAFTTGRAAEALGVQQAFLRALDTAGAVTPQRSAGGRRRYSRRQLAFAARIRELFDQGHTLAAAQRILALEEDLDDTNQQMIALKTIFRLMEESWLTHSCLGMNAVIDEAHKQVAFKQDKHFESDMSILFYMAVIENLQVGASQLLNLMALKLPFVPYAQLVLECLDIAKDNASLFHCVAEEYLGN